MTTVEQVPYWIVERGVGHVCESRNVPETGWSRTLCDMLGNFRTITQERPARICAECRRRLKTATLKSEPEPAHA
jgi:hypothetical protein